MTEFNCIWGLQSEFKALSIYTVVLLYDMLHDNEPGATQRRLFRAETKNRRKIGTIERGYYGR